MEMLPSGQDRRGRMSGGRSFSYFQFIELMVRYLSVNFRLLLLLEVIRRKCLWSSSINRYVQTGGRRGGGEEIVVVWPRDGARL